LTGDRCNKKFGLVQQHSHKTGKAAVYRFGKVDKFGEIVYAFGEAINSNVTVVTGSGISYYHDPKNLDKSQ
jgi:hypothetical protein